MNTEARNERIFYQDPSRTEFDAKVLEMVRMEGKAGDNNRGAGHVAASAASGDAHNLSTMRAKVRLDATIFYPEGGGQPPDLGWIGSALVVDVQEIDGDIWHTVLGEGVAALRVGETVHLRLDGARRLYHTQQHTGQHLLSAVLEQDYNIHTLSFHLGEEYCTIDVSAQNPADLKLTEIEAKVEAWIARDVPVPVHYCPPEDVASFRLRKRPPADEAVIRVVEIDGYDWSPCGGTHVERTGQIRALKIISVERSKGNTRLYFVAGAHALKVLAHAYEEARRAALLLNTGVENLAAKVAESIEKAAYIDKKYKRYAQASAETTVALAAASHDASSILMFNLEDEDAERAIMLIRSASTIGRAALALSVPDRTVVVETPSGGGFPALAVVLKPEMARFGGHGGGGPTFFRASFETVEDAYHFMESAKELLHGASVPSQ